MIIEAYAKVNLTLEVYGKRPDGYHALRSVVQPILLSDTLEIEWAQDGSISSDTGYGEKDLIVKAARCLGVGCRVKVTKRIPTGGGLGGGSADAAATLLALNELGGLNKSPEELATLGATIGSDVPALVLAQYYRAPILMEGRGEKVSLLSSPLEFQLPSSSLVLANPGVHSSTPEVYAQCVPRANVPTNKMDEVMGNDLQSPAIALHAEIGVALSTLREIGASDVMMSGSGATVFGFAKDAGEAEAMACELRARGYSAWSSRLLMR